jgi:phage tail sheath gpL-like
MTREQLTKLFTDLKAAAARASALHDRRNEGIAGSIAYHRAWTTLQEIACAYNAALNEYIAEHPEPVLETHGGAR